MPLGPMEHLKNNPGYVHDLQAGGMFSDRGPTEYNRYSPYAFWQAVRGFTHLNASDPIAGLLRPDSPQTHAAPMAHHRMMHANYGNAPQFANMNQAAYGY